MAPELTVGQRVKDLIVIFPSTSVRQTNLASSKARVNIFLSHGRICSELQFLSSSSSVFRYRFCHHHSVAIVVVTTVATGRFNVV